MAWICCFSAWPTPTTVFLTRFAAYSATGRPGERRHQQRDAARLAELQRRLRVLVDEGLLDRDLVRRQVGDDRGEAVVELAQALGERAGRRSEATTPQATKESRVALDRR